jgi:hypothetical protein
LITAFSASTKDCDLHHSPALATLPGNVLVTHAADWPIAHKDFDFLNSASKKPFCFVQNATKLF